MLTENWWILQGGVGPRAHKMWWTLFRVLELDNKAVTDWWLLLVSHAVGRACANKMMWDCLTSWAVQDPYYWDLSSWASSTVNFMRLSFDKPNPENVKYWSWAWHDVSLFPEWCPRKVPKYFIRVRHPDGTPLPPPACWKPTTFTIANRESQRMHGVEAVPGPQPTTRKMNDLHHAEIRSDEGPFAQVRKALENKNYVVPGPPPPPAGA